MVLAIKIAVAGLVIVMFLNALRKDLRELTTKQRKQPLLFILEILPVMGLITFIMGWVIFRNVTLGAIGILLCLVGFSIELIRQWKANSIRQNFKAIVILMLIAVLFIAFLR
ncbi:hypothetical protein [Sporosarcina obsidiansis]|uniref:hypothetical protein n=1 Tax=Sporosarcina obsidiansis TaxID=2660748 RepID=UPI00129B3B69|nr:hypothetical protein [Sporosarcina obsidiansis]